MQGENRKGIYRAALQAVAHDDADALAEYLDPDIIDHTPIPDQSRGLAGFREFMAAMAGRTGRVCAVTPAMDTRATSETARTRR